MHSICKQLLSCSERKAGIGVPGEAHGGILNIHELMHIHNGPIGNSTQAPRHTGEMTHISFKTRIS